MEELNASPISPPATLAPEERARVRRAHNNTGRCLPRRTCYSCKERWPCQPIRMLDALENAERRASGLELEYAEYQEHADASHRMMAQLLDDADQALAAAERRASELELELADTNVALVAEQQRAVETFRGWKGRLAAAARENERLARELADAQLRLDLLDKLNAETHVNLTNTSKRLTTVTGALRVLMSQAKAEAGSYELIPAHRVLDWVRKTEPALAAETREPGQ